ncbi:MAG: hypothetical protein WA160_05185 [Pseudobdellovibrio sp.]
MPQDKMSFQNQFNTQFQQGLALQQEKKWDDAVSKYQTLLDEGQAFVTNEQASVIYHNMSVIAFEKADNLKAYIWSKKSLSLNPDNTFAKSLSVEIAKKYQPVQIPHQISSIETFQKVTLKNVALDTLLIGFLLFLGLSVFIALKTLLARKKTQLESELLSVQKKNSLALIIGFCSLISISGLFLFLLIIKWSDISIPKAIITTDNTLVQTASGGNQATIFDASAGLEVDILKFDSDYVQIRYPGAFSGWVPKKNLEILSTPTWPNLKPE